MYLPCSKNIYPAFDFLWNLVSSKIYGHSQVGAPPEAVPAVEVFVNKPPPLFALLIGINEYISDEFEDLEGAVADAQAVKTYLETSLGVPPSQIKTLFNGEATRDAIIASLRDLRNNTSISRGNPVLIFYAGHGSTVEAPDGWEAGGPEIQILVSHDALSESEGKTIVGIPDRTMAVLLEQIAQEKGDNITVIFDCCYSGSMTRSMRGNRSRPPRVRGVKMPAKVAPDLDKNIWGGRRGTSIAPGFLKSGLRSHVLLSACGAEENAKEDDGRGYFTQRLLETLEAVGADKVTYADLIQRIPSLPSQSPQCEGHHQHRICFDSKAPVRSSRMYRVRKIKNQYVMDAGTIHGITDGAIFGLYNDRSMVLTQSPVAILTASKPEAFSTNMIPLPDGPPFDITEKAFALLARAGEQEVLRIHVAPDEELMNIFWKLASEMQIEDPAHPKFMLVEKETAELDITSDDNGVVFNILNPFITIHGFARIPFSVSPDPGAIGPVISKVAHYFWHLRRTGSAKSLQDNVGIEFTRLEEAEEEYDDDLNLVRKPCGEDLVKNGVIDIVVEENAIYGIKFTNKGNKPLYPSLFYFDNSDFSITSYFQPPTSSGTVDPPLPPYGSITIGYGAGGGAPFEYSLRKGQDVDIGFLKLFISTEPVDLSGISQLSPFEGTRGMRARRKISNGSWSTLLLKVVQRRNPPN